MTRQPPSIFSANYGNSMDVETRQKIATSLRGQPWTEARRIAHRAAMNRPEVKERLRAAMRGDQNPMRCPATLAQHGQVMRKVWARPEVKQKLLGDNNPMKRPENKAKIKEITNRPEYKERLRESMMGDRNRNWLGGSSMEPYPMTWTTHFKKLIRERDAFTCQIPECGAKENGRLHDVHHVDYDKRNCAPDNLIALCHDCHRRTNSHRDYWRGYFQARAALAKLEAKP